MKKVVLSILVIALIACAGVGGWFLGNSQVKEKEKTGEVENKTVNAEKVSKEDEKTTNETSTKKEVSKEEEKTVVTEKKETVKSKTYSDIKGTYETNGADTNYRLLLNEDGSFIAYYLNYDTDCHYVGYYTIVDNTLTLHSVVHTGNDPSANLNNKVFKFILNSDGTISDKENNKFTRKTTTIDEDTNIAKTIDSYLAGCTTSGKDGQGPWFGGLTE